MASFQLTVIFVACLCAPIMLCKPLEDNEKVPELVQFHPNKLNHPHSVERRFINPSQTLGGFADVGFSKIRTKRSEEECEKLQLCKLHARSSSNFFSAFQLYFVNKENAKLWDHRSRKAADCEQRFSGCFYE